MKKSELQKELGMNLQKARTERNMTREQLAEQAGISPTFLANLECGNKMMSLMTLKRLTDVLRVSADTILYGESPDNQIKNMEALLRNQPAEMIRYVEKLINLSVACVASICSDTGNDGGPCKEVRPDGTAE